MHIILPYERSRHFCRWSHPIQFIAESVKASSYSSGGASRVGSVEGQ